MESLIAQFCGVTGASVVQARRFLDKYNRRLDLAMDAYYNDSHSASHSSSPSNAPKAPSTTKLNALFDKYKDPGADEILTDGTIQFCSDLQVDPEDVVLLAIATDLGSKKMAEWNRKGWVDGWKALGCDTIEAMQRVLPQLKQKLGSDVRYFQKVYSHTFDFGRADGQRSLPMENAQAFWALLLPAGLAGGALSHSPQLDEDEDEDDDNDDPMDSSDEEGWKLEYNDWWIEYLTERGDKAVSKDTWNMLVDFIRTTDSRFAKYDPDAAWPSTIDDFVEWVKPRIANGE